MSAKTYLIHNSAMVTSAPPVKQPTGTSTRTMMQLAPMSNMVCRVTSWGCSFDGTAAATPGQVELLDSGTVFATMTTAYAVADIQPNNDPNAPANSTGSGGMPLALGTALSGFATTSVTEGSITSARMLDAELVAPTNQYVRDFPLGREPEIPGGHALRVRMTFGTSVNTIIWVVLEF